MGTINTRANFDESQADVWLGNQVNLLDGIRPNHELAKEWLGNAAALGHQLAISDFAYLYDPLTGERRRN